MEEYTDNQQLNEFENPKPQRPFWFMFLCIFSFISIGDSFLSSFLSFLLHGSLRNMLDTGALEDAMESFGDYAENMTTLMEEMIYQIVAIDRIAYLLLALLYAGAFVGVLYMIKLKKKGFHFYAISQILVLIVEVLFVTKVTSVVPWFEIILTAAFIGLFFSYYKRLME